MNKKEAKQIATEILLEDEQTEMTMNFLTSLLIKCENTIGYEINKKEYTNKNLYKKLRSESNFN